MKTPFEINALLTELRKIKDLSFFTMRMIEPSSVRSEGTPDHALNLFLLKVVTEAKEYWALEGDSLEAFKQLAPNWEDLVSEDYLRPESDFALVATKKTYDLFLMAIGNFYPEHKIKLKDEV